MKVLFWIACVAILIPSRLFAQAGPPYQTDDPDPVEYRHWEFYLATQHAAAADVATGTAPHVEVNYGAVPNLQLHVLVPLAYAHPAGGRTAFGAGEVELGAKFRFIQEGTRRPMVGTFVQTEWPTGNEAEGLGTGHLHVLLPLWVQKSFGAWSTDVGGGLWINPGAGNRNYWAAGWQVQRHLSTRATIGGEAYGTTADEVGGSSSVRVNIGVVVNMTDQHHLLASVGRSTIGERVVQGYFAYQFTIGPNDPLAR